MKYYKLMLLLTLTSAWVLAQSDTKGSADHPLFERYPGFTIEDQAIVEFDEADLLVGALSYRSGSPRKADLMPVEGQISDTYYRQRNADASLLQMQRNYTQALEKLGAEILFSCRGSDCFDSDQPANAAGINLSLFAGEANAKLFPGLKKRRFGGEIAVLTAKLRQDQAEYHVMWIFGTDDANQERHISQSVIKASVLDDQKIAIGSIDDISRAINASGKVILDGIFFDHDKASIKAESAATLKIIGDYLQANRSMRFFVVGHTDGSGSYSYNQNLSAARAKAVVDTLVQAGIDRQRLTAVGVGPVAPAASNRSDNGKSQNRRVELVENIQQ